MERSRLRDFTLGFLFCAAIAFSYHCGKSDSSSVLGPNSANASPLSSNLQAVAAQTTSGDVAVLVVDVESGKIVASEAIKKSALPSADQYPVDHQTRYW
jgi:hypothetical protein